MGCLLLILGAVFMLLFWPLGIILLVLGMFVEFRKTQTQGKQQGKQQAAAGSPRAILNAEILKSTDPVQEAFLKEKLRVLEAAEAKNRKRELILAAVGVGVVLVVFAILKEYHPTKSVSSPTPTATTSAEESQSPEVSPTVVETPTVAATTPPTPTPTPKSTATRKAAPTATPSRAR